MFGRCSVDFERLVDFSLGLLDGEEMVSLRVHLESGCIRCRRQLAWLNCVAGIMRSDDSVEPPTRVVQRALGLFSQRYPSPVAAAPLLSRIKARLVFDSQLALAPTAIRTGAPTARQLLYSAGDLDVDLHIESGEGQSEFTLMGQVLPTAGELDRVSGAEVQLLRGHRKMLSKTADRFGEFVFGRLPAGRYALRIRVRDQQVDLVGIQWG